MAMWPGGVTSQFRNLPLLQLAGHPVAVRPDTVLRVAAAAAGWEVLGRR